MRPGSPTPPTNLRFGFLGSFRPRRHESWVSLAQGPTRCFFSFALGSLKQMLGSWPQPKISCQRSISSQSGREGSQHPGVQSLLPALSLVQSGRREEGDRLMGKPQNITS